MPGTQLFTYANFGSETVRGTPVAPTRQCYVDGTDVLGFDLGLRFHEAENAGVRTRVRRVTQTKEDVALKLAWSEGVSFDDLVIPATQLKGGLSGAGAGADKTWTVAPSMTAANNPESYSIDVGDDVQNWRVQYGMMSRWKLSAALGDVTRLEADVFGQRAIKTAKASPALNSGIKIPGELWTIKYAATQAGLAGASISTNHLLSWELDVRTGLVWRHYMDGNFYGAQHVETDIAATYSATIESTALAVSEVYDKAVAGTLDFLRLKATGPALGGSAYSCQIDVPILWKEPKPIASADSGINLWKISANMAYDPTSAASLQMILVNSLAAKP